MTLSDVWSIIPRSGISPIHVLGEPLAVFLFLTNYSHLRELLIYFVGFQTRFPKFKRISKKDIERAQYYAVALEARS